MIPSRQQLQQESQTTGFKLEHLEKVFILMDLLLDFATFPQLKNKFVLKGGTALNLFFFNLPRLSVDIDLNYIGHVDREAMLAERPLLESAISGICTRRGLTLDKNPKRHAGSKMIWRYPSVLGNNGNLEIDLNFMYRLPLWPIEYHSSCMVGSYQVNNIPILNIHELAAGKLTALIDRKTGRDMFDAYHLLTQCSLDDHHLRLALVVYSAINRKIDLRQVSVDDIIVNLEDLRMRVVPLLRKDGISRKTLPTWAQDLAMQSQKAFKRLLPLVPEEIAFLTLLLDEGKIAPELLTKDRQLIENIKNHPAITWVAQNVQGREK